MPASRALPNLLRKASGLPSCVWRLKVGLEWPRRATGARVFVFGRYSNLVKLIYPKLALTEAQEQEGTEEGTMSEEASPSPLP